MYCKLDKSQTVRNHQFQLRQEIMQLKSENGDKEYRSRNMGIQERQPTEEWKILKPAQLLKQIIVLHVKILEIKCSIVKMIQTLQILPEKNNHVQVFIQSILF